MHWYHHCKHGMVRVTTYGEGHYMCSFYSAPSIPLIFRTSRQCKPSSLCKSSPVGILDAQIFAQNYSMAIVNV